MRILMFIFLGIALGDKLDRTYLPPPGSKFAGGSPGALQTPLEYPKETYSSTGIIGQNGDQVGPSQGVVNRQQTQQGFAPSGLEGLNNEGKFGSVIKGQQQQNLQDFVPTVQREFESNDGLRTPSAHVFAVTALQTPRPTSGSNQGPFNLQPEQPGFDFSSPKQPNAGGTFGLNQGRPGSYIFPSSNQQRPSDGQSFLPNQGPSQLDSQVFIPPGELPNFQQFPFASSTQSPLNNFLNNVPSTTTSYAFTQTTISPFDDVAGTVAPFGFDGQQPYDVPVQMNYPQNGIAPDQALLYQQGEMAAQNMGVVPQGGIAGQNQPTENRQHSLPGQVQLNDNRPFSQQGLIGQTRPSYNQQSQQNQGIYGASNQSRYPNVQDSRNQLQQQNSNFSQQIFSGLSSMQQAIYPGPKSENNIPQAGSQINRYQPSRGPSSQQSIPPSTGGYLPQFEGQFNDVQLSSFPERQPQNQQPGLNKNVQPNQQIQTQYSTTASPSQRFPQILNQYQSQYGPVTSTTAFPLNEDYSTPVSQSVDRVGDITPSRLGFSTPGLIQLPTTPRTFASSTASSVSLDTYSSSTSTYPGSQNAYNIFKNMPERVQAETDRNAAILNYEINLTPSGEFYYTFDTSNGIHADENGTAVDGVKAQGSFSYIGDDGKVYSVTYSADENGFVPMGDHLPTPPPIPDAIKRVIEQAMRDKDAGISNDGSYDEAKYGYKNYKGNMNHYGPLNRYESRKNKSNETPGRMKQLADVSNNEFDDEDKDYETLEDEIDDIKIGNRKPQTSGISGLFDPTSEDVNKTRKPVHDKARKGDSKKIKESEGNGKLGLKFFPKHPQDIKSARRKPGFVVDNTDDGYEGDYEETTAVNDYMESLEYYEAEKSSMRPNPIKPNQSRPSGIISENSKEDVNIGEDHNNMKETPKANRRRPNAGDPTAEHQDSKINYGTKKRPQNLNSNRRRPVLEEESTDEGIETEYEDDKVGKYDDDNKRRPNASAIDFDEKVYVDTKKPSKRLKPLNHKRPVSSLEDNGTDDDETDRTSTPSSGSSKFDVVESSVEDEYETEHSSRRPQSKVNRKRPNSTILDKATGENKENTEYESTNPSKRPVPSKFNRRRPDFETPENDDDAERQLESSRNFKKPQSSRMRPTSKTSVMIDQNEDIEYETKTPPKKSLPPKHDTSDKDAKESIHGEYEEKRPSKRPQSSKKRPNVNVVSSKNTETDYEGNTPSKRPESKRDPPNTSVNVKNTSLRRPTSRRPQVQSVDDNPEIDSETNAPTYNNFNTGQPIDDIFGDQVNISSKPDKQTKPELQSKASKVLYNDFEIPEKEDDYDYSLNVEPEEKFTTTVPFNKNRGPHRKKPNSISVEEEVEIENGDDFLDQKQSAIDNSQKYKQGQNAIRPTGSKTTTSYKEDNLNDDETSGFEQSTPSTQRFSTKKPLTKDGEKGYQYLPPQKQFDEQPGRLSFSPNRDMDQENLYFDENRPNGFQSSYSTTGAPQFDGQQATSRPVSQNQFDIMTPQDIPTNYYVKEYNQNVTPSPFASSKVVPQTTYETDVTSQPYFGQVSQSTPSQNTQKYPVTESNRHQTPEFNTGRFSTAPTPGFSSTHGPTYSTLGNQYDNDYSTTARPFRPNQNYYSETRPTYLPSSESPIRNAGMGQQISGNIPNTTYRPDYFTTTVTNYNPNFEQNEQGYQQIVPAYQRPIYGPGSTASDRNVYATNGPIQSGLNPSTYPQENKPTRFSTTEVPGLGFGQPIGFAGQGNELNKSGFGSQRFGPTGNAPSGFNKITGEDFSGPRRPQTYDPETGYHYK